MNYRKANRGFLGMVLLHFAVVIVLLAGRITSMSVLLNLFISEMMLVVPAFFALLLSGKGRTGSCVFTGLSSHRS